MAQKKRKLPKQPKRSASLQTWENYKSRCNEVLKYNAQLVADAKKKQGVIKACEGLRQRARV